MTIYGQQIGQIILHLLIEGSALHTLCQLRVLSSDKRVPVAFNRKAMPPYAAKYSEPRLRQLPNQMAEPLFR